MHYRRLATNGNQAPFSRLPLRLPLVPVIRGFYDLERASRRRKGESMGNGRPARLNVDSHVVVGLHGHSSLAQVLREE